MNIKKNIANRKNYGGTRNPYNIKYIVIHYTANDGDSDEANANYFKGIIGASAHYFVDNDSITQSVEDLSIAYSVGGKKLKGGGGSLHNIVTNSNSISIELCDSVKNGKSDFTENTLKQASELVKMLMDKYNIPLDKVVRHHDVTGKICPKPFVEDINAWNSFKNRISSSNINIGYDSHISTIGWQGERYNGQTSGTQGQSLRIEAIRIFSGDVKIQAQAHVQDIGWTEILSGNDITIGTQGRSKRLEALTIKSLDLSHIIKYRVHIQDIGWSNWLSQGQICGTVGKGLRIEAIEITIS